MLYCTVMTLVIYISIGVCLGSFYVPYADLPPQFECFRRPKGHSVTSFSVTKLRQCRRYMLVM